MDRYRTSCIVRRHTGERTAVLDTIYAVERLPLTPGKSYAQSVLRFGGGVAGNTAVTVSVLGGEGVLDMARNCAHRPARAALAGAPGLRRRATSRRRRRGLVPPLPGLRERRRGLTPLRRCCRIRQ